MRLLRRIYYVGAYYLSWLMFGGGGLVLNIVCAILLLLPQRRALGHGVRRMIRWLFDFWLRWLHATKLARITWRGFDRPLTPGTVYVANHPSLIDATFLLARLPDAVCIFKPRLMRNPVIGPAAIMAGYVPGDAGVDSLRLAAEQVAAGCSVLIFPEGTRTTPGTTLNELKGGFALIAARAHAPVQLITMRVTPGTLARGQRWWKPPQMPAEFELTLDRRWEHDPNRHAADLTTQLAQHLRAVLAS